MLKFIAPCLFILASSHLFSKELSLNFVVSPKESWTTDHIEGFISEVNEVYQQCGISIKKGSIKIIDKADIFPDWNRTDPKASNSIFRLREKYSNVSQNKVTVFLISSIENKPRISGFSRAQWSHGRGQVPELFNTIWLTEGSLSAEYRRRNDGRYSLLSHELLHVLTLDGEHISPDFESMMSVSSARTNRILSSNCQLARQSPWLDRP